ncbi:MAG: hypothetical protein KatS3mg022_1240 [Armatimonadota bacterium]|nr:MAG: hypothetical protein KatS3mg022_1240 [Armatimonadota bacterium]
MHRLVDLCGGAVDDTPGLRGDFFHNHYQKILYAP